VPNDAHKLINIRRKARPDIIRLANHPLGSYLAQASTVVDSLPKSPATF
jgi:hypothetical protein